MTHLCYHVSIEMNRLSILQCYMIMGGVISEVHSWRCKADTQNGIDGAQIDLLLHRNERIIDVFEVKYSETEYAFSKREADSMKTKIASFAAMTGTRCAIHPILITTYGLKNNLYSDTVQGVVTLDDLFV